MELFRTLVPVPPSQTKINHSRAIVLTGSCFSESIGDRLAQSKFRVVNNPFGIVYNPLSIASGLSRIIRAHAYTNQELFEYNSVWSSWDHHSRFSNINPELCLSSINQSLSKAHQTLSSAQFLFITLGSAWVYKLLTENRIVSNCHKLPAKNFQKLRLEVDDIVSVYRNIITELHSFNPQLNIIFTVSPVRHWADGAHQNQLSKSTLLLAIDALCSQFANVQYFPSYEIIMDELRDYRFYADDMLHPSELAVDYIWDKFSESFFTPSTIDLLKQIKAIRNATQHRPFSSSSSEFRSFVQRQLETIFQLQNLHNLDFAEEVSYFNSFL